MGQLRDSEGFFDKGEVGDWCFLNNDTYIAVLLHSDEDGLAMIPIKHDPQMGDVQHVVWQWDGNREAPTLTPSILHHSHKEWHGYLREGKLVVA